MSNVNPVDVPDDNFDRYGNRISTNENTSQIPITSSGDFAPVTMPREGNWSSPLHILFNQVGSLLQRYNKSISPKQVQRNFIQRIVSTIEGSSFPLMYLMGSCFPRHFYASSTADNCAILGCPPLSCYSGVTNPNGFASSLSIARNLGTHSSSSTSTCPIFWSFLYDIQANKVASDFDSRLIGRRGFTVAEKSKNGLRLRDDTNKSNMTEGVDSHQSALDLAATQNYLKFHLFLTLTCNQSTFPGIKHLHHHKESMEWTKNYFPCESESQQPLNFHKIYHQREAESYIHQNQQNQRDIKKSFEMAYGSILGRCWMEVRKLWLDYISYSTSSILRKTTHVFFRDEYQEESGNLAHIHGLIALSRDDMNNEEFQTFVEGLTKSAVCDLFPTSEIDRYVEEGLFESEDDWKTLTASAERVLCHVCDRRCLRRISDGDGPDCYACRKPHSVFAKNDPMVPELIPFKFNFSDACLDALKGCGLWDPPTDDAPNGTFRNDLFEPKRYMGALHPGARCNMSPVIPEFFAVTKSMQNVQILSGTNAVAKYVVKYVVKMDKGNRCTIWADPHNGAVHRAEYQFLHNTKVVGSKINEDKAHEKSRKWKLPSGRAVAFTEMQQQILGYPELMTNIVYERICTKPFELRSSTRVQLNRKGKLKRPDQSPHTEQERDNAPDAQSGRSPSEKARIRLRFPQERLVPDNQSLLYGNNIRYGAYNKVTLFSLRPVELLELVKNIGKYYRWFETEKKIMAEEEIVMLLKEDITECHWVDVLGRLVKLRKGAKSELKEHLNNLENRNLKEHSIELKEYLLEMINNDMDEESFVVDEGDKHLPVPVFSSITPKTPIPFLNHIMLSIGEFETELDIRMQSSLRKSLAKVGLIGDDFDDPSRLQEYCNKLLRITIEQVLSVQPFSLRRLDDCVVKAKMLFEAVIIRDEIPVHDLPPCLLTELLDSKNEEFENFWKEKRKDQLSSIYRSIPEEHIKLPDIGKVMNFERDLQNPWDPMREFKKIENQSEESYDDQVLAVAVAYSLIEKYCIKFGRPSTTFTKNAIVHGAPGSGKSHIILYISLIAMYKGLRVMTTALMGVRANALGGVHMHRLFGMSTRSGNPYRLAELALDKLNRKNQLKYLHVLLTMDVLIVDECGQLSADQLSTIDIILRTARSSNIPFGGVLIFGTMDHTQLGAINGWPFLLSSHILSEFVFVQLSHSVRAFNDKDFQELQKLTRMCPSDLLKDPKHEERFKELMRDLFDYVPDWDSKKIDPNVQRMYARRMPAYEAAKMFVDSCRERFEKDGTEFQVSKAINLQRTEGTRNEFSENIVTDDLLSAMNHGLREPEKLLFFRGAQFEATLNGEGYNQSQLLLMLDVPTENAVKKMVPIELMAAPPTVTYLDLSEGIPSKEMLVAQDWKSVIIERSPERTITCRGAVGKRIQYSLRHIGSSTINKQLGNTIRGKCAMECSEECSPFCKEQVVVGLSRTCNAKDTIIVGDKEFAVKRLWELITMSNQWTNYIEKLLKKLSINVNDVDDANDVHNENSTSENGGNIRPWETNTFHFADDYPYRTSDIAIPSGSSGFVYMLVSCRDFDRDYIGQTEILTRRFDQHQTGRGSEGTRDPYFHPYALAGFICGMAHMSKSEREGIEQRWKNMNRRQINAGNLDLETRLEQGRRIVEDYNRTCDDPTERIQFYQTIRKEVSTLNIRDSR